MNSKFFAFSTSCALFSVLLLAAFAPDSLAQSASKKTVMLQSCEPAKFDSKSSPKLKATIQQTDKPTNGGSWMEAPIEDINKEFMVMSSQGGYDFCDEVPKRDWNSIYQVDGGWSHSLGTYPEGMPYPNWHSWQGGVHDLAYQLRWELLTDPAQKAIKLGQVLVCPPDGGSTVWRNDTSGAPCFGKVLYGKGGEGSCWYPALSYKSYFNGKIRIMLDVDKHWQLKARVLSSTLPPAVTERFKQSFELLSGHPALAFPKIDPQREHMNIICAFEFHEEPYMGPVKKAIK